MTDDSHSSVDKQDSKRYLAGTTLAALGVVFGDIGTSPLYAIKETLHHGHNLDINVTNIYGILSLIFWSLIFVISIKYIFFILKADKNGEGGILALTSMVSPKDPKDGSLKYYLIMLGLFGTALLYGDGVITPAISVLSAVEGLSLITPFFDPYIIPITIVILVLLFSFQKKGTAVVGRVFGPITLMWFLCLGGLGIWNILKHPSILISINPYYAINFFIQNSWQGLTVLGSVFLVITGGEALYSDLGHFGRKPITYGWFILVLPCLLLNYLGQGALVLFNPDLSHNPFFLMAPSWALTPLVVLATFATVIASQALITGIFSMTMQGLQSGYISRMKVVHTSEHEYGQIYIQTMNIFLMCSCIVLVMVFRSSSNLAAAYGMAVTCTMGITTILFHFYVTHKLNWSIWKASIICGTFLIFDLCFFSANLVKFFDGGWVPLMIGLGIFLLMTTWKTGRKILSERLSSRTSTVVEFIEQVKLEQPYRIDGTAVYMSSSVSNIPYALVHTYQYFKSLHKQIILLSVKTNEIPYISPDKRLEILKLEEGFHCVVIHFGYMEIQNVPRALHKLNQEELKFDARSALYFIGKEKLVATDLPGMAIWREHIFAFLSLNAQDATTYFHLPANRVVEIGKIVEI